MPTIKDLLDAFAASWRVALVALVASTALLAADWYKLEYVADTSRWVINGAFIVGIVSGAILISYMVAQLAKVIAYPFKVYAERKSKKDVESKLKAHAEGIHSLPRDQKYILAYFYTTKQRAFPAMFNHPRLVALIQLGYVARAGGTHSAIDWPHYIPQHIWDELEENSEGYTIGERELEYPLRTGY
ncbi:hypothetical protein F9K94_17410 [Brucella tritici]|uniref:Superinfection exclusion protein B n=1 Tax=Brucella tritici TaxID=94626 RepID=A0A7V7VSU1_9HYPH|nr:super-infection exclusion protein B [Brucella tritici]KAB2656277.1 hypothetical protein F9K94_17410 [Brucella tritici]